ncbi:FGGY family carbohydrate kinase [Saccharopolyspora sp. WRP15-2]|uniref:FGGY family carbohydrate kinase n=1 Tax=Saccharopolyspora oryzae TaxID=2997343 RepID=A0ABT4V026_9PSEU|nr:FGGY family carbohydrate kinase [Saccharopolyspora oryzae]MDA3627307.1 FGGY family carbohydrate kinase [Saccharopolyspora oryzae]
MSGTRRGVLAIDEGSTGTRAAVVTADGASGQSFYQPIAVLHPDPLRVEQDAGELWRRTLEVAQQAVRWAGDNAVEIIGVALCTQRATAVLWERETGRPLAPAVVWQDRRYAAELEELAARWDPVLLARTGRPVGSRSPFLWAARQIEQNPQVAAAAADGRLLFGPIDTWLSWNLNGGTKHGVATSNAAALGGYRLRDHAWDAGWLDAVGCPVDLAPPLVDDDGDFGWTDPGVLGVRVPIAAAMGDQHASLIALGALEAGQGMCVHGTGTFVGALTGDEPADATSLADGVLALPGWRSGGRTRFSLEAYTATTGSALRWLVEDLQLFDSAEQVSELAGKYPREREMWFVPTLAGLRTPIAAPGARACLTGLSLATSRAGIARAVLEGIAHSVCDTVDGICAAVPSGLTRLRVGGGLAASDALLQSQADLSGIAIERAADSATASLRGVAYLAGVRLGLWGSLDEALHALPAGRAFEPAIGEDERQELRAQWGRVLRKSLPEEGKKC